MKYLDQSVLAVKKVFDLAKIANDMLAAKGINRRIDTIDMGGGLLPEVLSCEAKCLHAFSRCKGETKQYTCEHNAQVCPFIVSGDA